MTFAYMTELRVKRIRGKYVLVSGLYALHT